MAHLITGLIFLPILGALFASVAPRGYGRAIALGSNLITALFALTVSGITTTARPAGCS